MIQLTSAAAQVIQRFIGEAANPVAGLRVAIRGGGCAGLEYGLKLEREKAEDDWDVEVAGVRLLIDPMSFPLLASATLDYVESAGGSRFHFNNPDVPAGCSCGQSSTSA